MSRCVVVGGAPIADYERARAALRPGDRLVYCDSGLRHLEGLGAAPDLVVGDLDSYAGPLPDCEIITLPREKDDTDTVYAVKEALRRGLRDFLLLGVFGGRLDHTMGNAAILLALDKLGARALAMDDCSEMEIVSGKPVHVADSWRFFSLLAMGGPARGVTVTGAKFPLEDAEITPEYQYGVSNEPMPGGADISVAEGRLLLVKVARDLP